MPIFVDQLASRGWIIRGRLTANCHMFTDELDLEPLHLLAAAIGMKRAWFQDRPAAPHYDLTPSRRTLAIAHGAQELDRRAAAAVWRRRRELLLAHSGGRPQSLIVHAPFQAP